MAKILYRTNPDINGNTYAVLVNTNNELIEHGTGKGTLERGTGFGMVYDRMHKVSHRELDRIIKELKELGYTEI